jgi:hypothetical protein
MQKVSSAPDWYCVPAYSGRETWPYDGDRQTVAESSRGISIPKPEPGQSEKPQTAGMKRSSVRFGNLVEMDRRVLKGRGKDKRSEKRGKEGDCSERSRGYDSAYPNLG